MSTAHISAKKGEIAERILLPGDPLRAKYIAETYLKNPVCYNEVRNMLGFTGLYKGKRISVQGTGMGIPSISIYVNELIKQYGAKRLIRIGTCGSIQEEIKLRDLILAMSASTDSAINTRTFQGSSFAPTADAKLLFEAVWNADKLGLSFKAGNILTSDNFYEDDPDFWKIWAKHNVLAIEMETAALFTIAAKHNAQALSILTVSDSILQNTHCTPQERQLSFNEMMKLALETI